VKEINLLPAQERFLDSNKRFILFSGGFGCGKTFIACFKALQLATQSKNYGLIGRLTYPELRDTVQKVFLEICPPEWIKNWKESEGRLILKNDSEIIFRHLDKVSEEEIKSMDLGFFFIDQVEEISENVFLALRGRLRRSNVQTRQGIMTCNPLLFWAYKVFRQTHDPDYELIEGSTLDNKTNLPEDYIADLLKYPENWKRQFVYGIWDESLLSDRSVIPVEYIQAQRVFAKKELRKLEGIAIFEDVGPEYRYQFGLDVSEGLGQDYSAFSGFNCTTGEQVCFWKGQIQPDLLADKILPVLHYFKDGLIIPEVNGIGLATLTRLKDKYDNIYHREEFDKENNIEKRVLGWKTTFATKPLLVDNFLKLLREGLIKIRAEEVVNEMPTFVYTDEARRKGMGAEQGFYDDGLIATMLACWNMQTSRIATQPLPSFDNLLAGGRAGY
jgi:hypothetical protein